MGFQSEPEQTIDMNNRDYYRGNGAANDDLDMVADNVVKSGALLTQEMFTLNNVAGCGNEYGCMLQFTLLIDLTYMDSEVGDGGRHAQTGGNRNRRRLVDYSVSANESMSKVGKAVATIMAKPNKGKKTYKCGDKKNYKGCMAAAKASKKGKNGPTDGPCYWKQKKCIGANMHAKKSSVMEGVTKRMCGKLSEFSCSWDDKCMCEH